jgi:hypothetical protein
VRFALAWRTEPLLSFDRKGSFLSKHFVGRLFLQFTSTPADWTNLLHVWRETEK